MIINWTSITTIDATLGAANTATGGWFWLGMLCMLDVIVILFLMNTGVEAALFAGGFFGLVLGILFAYMNLIAWQWVLAFVGLIIFVFIYSTYNRQSY
jgi:hypothetical protein